MKVLFEGYKVEVKYVDKLPFSFLFHGVEGLTLNKTIYILNSLKEDTSLLRHELVHVGQIIKTGFAKWYWNYLVNKKFRYDQELEAYAHQIHSYIVSKGTNLEDYKKKILNYLLSHALNYMYPSDVKTNLDAAVLRLLNIYGNNYSVKYLDYDKYTK